MVIDRNEDLGAVLRNGRPAVAGYVVKNSAVQRRFDNPSQGPILRSSSVAVPTLRSRNLEAAELKCVHSERPEFSAGGMNLRSRKLTTCITHAGGVPSAASGTSRAASRVKSSPTTPLYGHDFEEQPRLPAGDDRLRNDGSERQPLNSGHSIEFSV